MIRLVEMGNFHQLSQAGEFVEASKAAVKVEGHQRAVTTLLVANSYEQDDLVGKWGGQEGYRPNRY